jgi:hypothetical protein
MKKTALFFMLLVLLGTICVTGLAWAQIQKQPAQPVQLKQVQTAPKKVFISSQTYVGNLGGVSGADQLCQRLATTAGLTGTFKAWLGVAGSTPATRWAPRAGTYVRRDGALVANSWNEIITTGKILKPIILDEYGRQVTVPPYDPYGYILVWTGMIFTRSTSGTLTLTNNVVNSVSCDCSKWTEAYSWQPPPYGLGAVGVTPPPGSQEYTWTLWSYLPCGQPVGHIYCFEQ